MFSRNQIKMLAVVFMIIDHIGVILFPNNYIFRAFGRLSFPLFAYLIAQGILTTKNSAKMIKQLITFALVSQLPFVLSFQLPSIFFNWNIFVTLSLGACFCATFKQSVLLGFFTLPLLCICSSYFFHSDYGAYGVLMISYFFLILNAKESFDRKGIFITTKMIRILFFCGLLILTWFHSFSHSSILQLIAPFAVFLLPAKEKEEKRWGLFGYCIYPLHLLILKVISIFV